ncbi:hypothetical protein PVAP13_3NG183309 [Panicum virgatum]|uniref:Uncharacterized protein n=1 Tax=Panicum virgatum TaxID=38727 RepID=A0A8T0U486_PANVG|nr:hypothetical protein PVAP13_3NG183309 [Panicum virgatum]
MDTGGRRGSKRPRLRDDCSSQTAIPIVPWRWAVHFPMSQTRLNLLLQRDLGQQQQTHLMQGFQR